MSVVASLQKLMSNGMDYSFYYHKKTHTLIEVHPLEWTLRKDLSMPINILGGAFRNGDKGKEV